MELLAFVMSAFPPENLLAIVAGVLVGFVIGALPGFDITTGVALLLPLTYTMAPDHALIFFSAVYCSGVFGGSITAILFNVPGTSESVMTAVEGYPFTQQGKPGLALGTTVMSSGISGVLSALVLIALAPALAAVALRFGPSEYAALGILGLACVASAVGIDVLKGLAAAVLGLIISTIGIDPITSTPRFVFYDGLTDGVDFVAAIIGLFAVGHVLQTIARGDLTLTTTGRLPSLGRLGYPSLGQLLELRLTVFRSWLIGLLMGIVPGVGASSAAFIAHGVAKRVSREPERFGKGYLHGVAAPEAANNSAAVGALIPLLSLGIPGSGTAAVILGAFAIHNLQPGPLLFIQQPQLVQQVLWSILLANIAFILMSFIAIRPLIAMVRVPTDILSLMIVTLSVGGSIAVGGLAAMFTMLGFAGIGLLFWSLRVPVVPLILGLVLGPIIEVSLRRALLMHDDSFLELLRRPITLALLCCALAFILVPSLYVRLRDRPGEHSG